MTSHVAATALRTPTPDELRLIHELNALEHGIPGSSGDSRFLLYLRHAAQIDERAAARLRQLAKRYLAPRGALV